MSLWGRKPFLAVRLLGRDGYYPRFRISTKAHRFEATDDLVWMAVVQSPLPADWETSESPTFIPEEIRLITAISLCVADPWHDGIPTVTRLSDRWEEVVDGDIDLTSEAGEARVRDVVATLQERHRDRMATALRADFKPTGDLGSEDDALSILGNFDMEDELLLAGLANLHTAARLMGIRYHEPEASALCMFVAMSAALEFIRLHLNEVRGTANTSFAEVHAYLGTVYPAGNFIPEYLEEVYEHRIIAIHPAGRFGEYWTPPLMADDVFDLRKHLMVIYRHIILGEAPQLRFE